MFETVIVCSKCAAGIIWRIDVNASDLSSKFMFQRLQRKEVISEDQLVIEDVILRDALFGVMGQILVLDQNPGLKARPILLPNPG